MLSIRFITAGAALVVATGLATGLAVGTAMAQSATDQAPGKPISLLQILQGRTTTTTTTTTTEAEPAAAPSVAVAKRPRRLRLSHHYRHHAAHVAAATEPPAPKPEPDAADAPAQAGAPAQGGAPTQQTQWSTQGALAGVPTSTWSNTWPGGDTPSLAGVAPDPMVQAAAAADAEPSPSELVVNGRTVQIASPDQVNAIDLAADKSADADSAAPAQSIAALAQQDNSSRDAWYEELLATLGGALAAGLVAWFLIGASPSRAYG